MYKNQPNREGRDETHDNTTTLTNQERRAMILNIKYAQGNLNRALKDLREDNEAYDQSAIDYTLLTIKNLQA